MMKEAVKVASTMSPSKKRTPPVVSTFVKAHCWRVPSPVMGPSWVVMSQSKNWELNGPVKRSPRVMRVKPTMPKALLTKVCVWVMKSKVPTPAMVMVAVSCMSRMPLMKGMVSSKSAEVVMVKSASEKVSCPMEPDPEPWWIM